jgi:hypothetical protein
LFLLQIAQRTSGQALRRRPTELDDLADRLVTRHLGLNTQG